MLEIVFNDFRKVCVVLFAKLFVVRKRPLKFHGSKLYSKFKQLEMFRTLFHVLDANLCFGTFVQILSTVLCSIVCFKCPFSQGVPKEKIQQ